MVCGYARFEAEAEAAAFASGYVLHMYRIPFANVECAHQKTPDKCTHTQTRIRQKHVCES